MGRPAIRTASPHATPVRAAVISPAQHAANSPMLSLPAQIAAQIAGRITAGTYATAQRIMEQALAAEFGVSRGPVRDALRWVEHDGLVTILARTLFAITRLRT